MYVDISSKEAQIRNCGEVFAYDLINWYSYNFCKTFDDKFVDKYSPDAMLIQKHHSFAECKALRDEVFRISSEMAEKWAKENNITDRNRIEEKKYDSRTICDAFFTIYDMEIEDRKSHIHSEELRNMYDQQYKAYKAQWSYRGKTSPDGTVEELDSLLFAMTDANARSKTKGFDDVIEFTGEFDANGNPVPHFIGSLEYLNDLNAIKALQKAVGENANTESINSIKANIRILQNDFSDLGKVNMFAKKVGNAEVLYKRDWREYANLWSGGAKSTDVRVVSPYSPEYYDYTDADYAKMRGNGRIRNVEGLANVVKDRKAKTSFVHRNALGYYIADRVYKDDENFECVFDDNPERVYTVDVDSIYDGFSNTCFSGHKLNKAYNMYIENYIKRERKQGLAGKTVTFEDVSGYRCNNRHFECERPANKNAGVKSRRVIARTTKESEFNHQHVLSDINADMVDMTDPVSILHHYCNTQADRSQITEYFREIDLTGKNRRVSSVLNEQYSFMNDVCHYLDERGIKYSFSVENYDVNGDLTKAAYNTKKALTLCTENPKTQIRLFSADEPQYRGRIFADGRVTRLKVSASMGNADKANETFDKFATNEDYMGVIKYYFGDTVNVSFTNERNNFEDGSGNINASLNGQYVVGQNFTYEGENGKIFNGSSIGHLRDDVSSNVYVIRDIQLANGKHVPLAVSTDLSSYKSGEVTFESFKATLRPYLFEKDENGNIRGADSIFDEINYDSKLPSEKVYPVDFHNKDISVVDSDGEFYSERSVVLSTEDYNLPDGTVLTKSDRLAYYRKLYVRETLQEWVDSAKNEYDRLVDLDDMLSVYESYLNNGDIESASYPWDGDESVARTQQLYWDLLIGTRSFDDIANEVNDLGIELNVNDDSTYEEKRDFIVRYHKAFIDNEFGNVPELAESERIMKLNNKRVNDTAAKGFSVSMVSKFVNTPNSYSYNENKNYITYMLSRLDYADAKTFLRTSEDDYDSRDILAAIRPFNVDGTSEMAEKSNFNLGEFIRSFDLQGLSTSGNIAGASVLGDINDPDHMNEVLNAFKRYSNNDFVDTHPFAARMLMHTANSLALSGSNPNDINVAIDDSGLIHFTARVPQSRTANDAKFMAVDSTIGPIVEPGKYGELVVGDRVIKPNLRGYYIHSDIENPNQPAVDRLRVEGYESVLVDNIRKACRNATQTLTSEYNFMPHSNDLAPALSGLYADRDSVENYYRKLGDNEAYKKYTGEDIPEELVPNEATVTVTRAVANSTKLRIENDAAGTAAASDFKNNHYTEFNKTDGSIAFALTNSDGTNPRTGEPHDPNKNVQTQPGNELDPVVDREYISAAGGQGSIRCIGSDVEQNMLKHTLVNNKYSDPNVPEKEAKDGCKCEMSKLHESYCDDVTAERKQMKFKQFYETSQIVSVVRIAYCQLNGYNFDDGFPVRRRFAENNKLQRKNGKISGLVIGDKLTDPFGNKGVISKVIDERYCMDAITDHLMADYKNLGIEKGVKEIDYVYAGKEYKGLTIRQDISLSGNKADQAILARSIAKQIQAREHLQKDEEIAAFFYHNPELDIVGAPFFGMGRNTGGPIEYIQDLAKNPPADLYVPDPVSGKYNRQNKIEAAIVDMEIGVLDKTAENKTHDPDPHHGKNRNASGQLVWSLHKAPAAINALYGNNTGGFDKMREVLLVMANDLTEDTAPVDKYSPRENESVTIIGMPQQMDDIGDLYNHGKPRGNDYINDTLNKAINIDSFSSIINEQGGFMQLPFDLTCTLQHRRFKNGKYSTGSLGDNGFKDIVDSEDGKSYYYLHVLSPEWRSGHKIADGVSVGHDYTRSYEQIYKCALKYKMLETKADQIKAKMSEIEDNCNKNNEKLDNNKQYASYKEEHDFYEKLMKRQVRSAQREYDKFTQKLFNNDLSTKDNIVRKTIMTNGNVAYSGTKVWSADPNLNLDEVAMSMSSARSYGLAYKDENGKWKLKEDAMLAVWRDPCLNDGAVRGLKVVINNNLVGCAVNPMIDKSFSGDFDGDSVGLVNIMTKEGKNDVKNYLSIRNNLLDEGTVTKDESLDYVSFDDESYGYKHRVVDGHIWFDHPLYINTELDVTANEYAEEQRKADNPLIGGPNLKQRRLELTEKINELEAYAKFAPDKYEFKLPAMKDGKIVTTDDDRFFDNGEPVYKLDSYGHPIPKRDENKHIIYSDHIKLDINGKPLIKGYTENKMPIYEYEPLYEQEKAIKYDRVLTGKDAIEYARDYYTRELSIYARLALKNVGGSGLSFKNNQTLADSIQNIADSGAKGNVKKGKLWLDNGGVDSEVVDINGKSTMKAIIECTVVNTDHGKTLKQIDGYAMQTIDNQEVYCPYVLNSNSEKEFVAKENIVRCICVTDKYENNFIVPYESYVENSSKEDYDVASEELKIEYNGSLSDINYAKITNDSGQRIPKCMRDGTYDDRIIQSQTVASFKTANTQIGGTYAQKFVAAFREFDTKAAMELTFPITQAILQSKHDADDALEKDRILKHLADYIFEGCKVTNLNRYTVDETGKKVASDFVDEHGRFDRRKLIDAEHKPVMTPVYENGNPKVDKNGNPVMEHVKCTPAEWKEQMFALYEMLNVPCNPEYVNSVAKAMTAVDKDGKEYIRGLSEQAQVNGNLIDRIAYQGFGFELFKAVEENANRPENNKICMIPNAESIRKDLNGFRQSFLKISQEMKDAQAINDNGTYFKKAAELCQVQDSIADYFDNLGKTSKVAALLPNYTGQPMGNQSSNSRKAHPSGNAVRENEEYHSEITSLNALYIDRSNFEKVKKHFKDQAKMQPDERKVYESLNKFITDIYNDPDRNSKISYEHVNGRNCLRLDNPSDELRATFGKAIEYAGGSVDFDTSTSGPTRSINTPREKRATARVCIVHTGPVLESPAN